MKLDKNQKDTLKSLINHPGWKIVELVNEEELNNLGRSILETANLSNQDDIKIIQENQLYVKARQDFIRSIKEGTLDVYVPFR